MPVPLSPREGISLLDTAVQFCWQGTEDGFGYELQYVPVQTAYAHMPEAAVGPGKWFWRVRTMTNEGTFGQWSEVRSFTCRHSLRAVRRDVDVSAARPLFICHLHNHDEIDACWQSIPGVLRTHSVLRVERHTTGDLLKVREAAERCGVPIVIQLAGPHDSYGGRYARIPLADVEMIYQRFTQVKGTQIVEQSCQGGLARGHVTRYLIGMMRLAAGYGKVAVWGDGHWHGNNVWLDAAQHAELFHTMAECSEHVVPMWKMNCGWCPYAVQGAVYGLWAAGAVANWGIEPESWYWYEAGLGELGEPQKGSKEGRIEAFPATFWGQMVLTGLSGGATAYCFEPQDGIWSAPGSRRPPQDPPQRPRGPAGPAATAGRPGGRSAARVAARCSRATGAAGRGRGPGGRLCRRGRGPARGGCGLRQVGRRPALSPTAPFRAWFRAWPALY